MTRMLEMRTSERRSLKHCTQQWYWSTVEGLAPIRAANPLWFGSAVHEGLAGWYLSGFERGVHPTEGFLAALEGERSMIATDEEGEQAYMDARELGVDMLNRYVQEYGKDERWDVIATERTFNVVLRRPAIELFGVKTPEVRRWLRYVGTWDGVYRDAVTGEIWLMEHKTAASIRIDHLPLDDQAGSYFAIANHLLRKEGVLKPGENLAGIMYNFLRKARGDDRPTNERGEYTNLPKKEHYVSALYNHFGEDSPSEEMASWEEDLPKMTLQELKDLAAVQKLQVLGDVSKSQPPRYFDRFPVYRSAGERRRMIRRIQEEALFSEAYRNGWLPVTKSPSMMNCPFCPFRVMCTMDEQGEQLSVEEFKASQFVVRDPYAAHHQKKSAE